MFKKNDLLMSQDTLYKERITYVRVLDRLNIGRGPRVEIIRGGLLKKFIVLRLTSPYNNPISVNIFVGCANKKYTNPPWKIIRPTKKTTTVNKSEKTTKDPRPKEEKTENPREKSTLKTTENSPDAALTTLLSTENLDIKTIEKIENITFNELPAKPIPEITEKSTETTTPTTVKIAVETTPETVETTPETVKIPPTTVEIAAETKPETVEKKVVTPLTTVASNNEAKLPVNPE
ncbi:Uncharacterized protein OBRU01_02487 [Operophtera brumata]|uniref:Uncharacterized protein n=1 Tax=Operophtera brumata TaxID=104452 RepID=A0A0L7LSA2_OPEBR|nr:Uncharacterized protein OBRU01_02487 [Operophtera brumata]